jgi:hypothetical protein
MRAAPAVPCAKWVEKTHTSIQVQRRTSDIPCAMALRLITRSPRRRIRLVTVIGELTEYPRPVGPTLLRRFDTSNGCRNHTTSPYAATSFVCAPAYRSRASPPCDHPARQRCRVHRIPPRVRDDRDPPLLSGETGELVEMICPTGIADYFTSKDWTGQIMLESFGKSVFMCIEKSKGK